LTHLVRDQHKTQITNTQNSKHELQTHKTPNTN